MLGHESFGVVEAVGPDVTHVKPGDYVTATVRRPGGSIYDQIGTSDMTSEETYYERGINLLHGFLTEYYVDDAEFIVKMPDGLETPARAGRADELRDQGRATSLRSAAPLARVAAENRLRDGRRPDRAAQHAGPAAARARRLTRSRAASRRRSRASSSKPWAHTTSARPRRRLAELAKQVGKADLIIDATGSSAIAFGCMQLLGHNGVLVWTSVTGGLQHVDVPSDKVNLDWVLGNKLLLGSVNANREHFEMGIKDLALGEVMYPGVLERILTTPIRGLDNYRQMMARPGRRRGGPEGLRRSGRGIRHKMQLVRQQLERRHAWQASGIVLGSHAVAHSRIMLLCRSAACRGAPSPRCA